MDGKANLTVKPAISLFLVVLVTSTTVGKIIYVDDDATGGNDGSSWESAYNFLQDALADANSAGKPVEIRVAQGVYKPDQGANQTPGDREATFQLINGVTLKGGYVGFSEPDPDARGIEAHETILSGDLNGDDSQTWPSNRDENTYHVVTGSGTNTTAALDGFTVTGGDATNEEFPWSDLFICGGGMHNGSDGSPTVINCMFSANGAYAGGGMYNENSDPTLIGCTFSENGAVGGGGMYNKNSSPLLIDCTFSKNDAMHNGGMANSSSSPSLINCTFKGNSAFLTGAMSSGEGTATLVNCAFSGNLALIRCGGGMYSYSSSATLINCTFAGNRARLGGNALDCSSDGGPEYRSNVTLINCIFWDGGEEISNDDGSTIITAHSDVQGGQTAIHDPCNAVIWGTGNIDADPCFVDPGHWEDPCDTVDEWGDDVWADGDYHLKSQAGRYDPNSSSWIVDDVTSPCVDAGDPMSPIGHEPFPNGGVVNMGAYGGTAEGSKSYLGEPVCETIVAGDINGDCKVDLKDFMILAYHWLKER